MYSDENRRQSTPPASSKASTATSTRPPMDRTAAKPRQQTQAGTAPRRNSDSTAASSSLTGRTPQRTSQSRQYPQSSHGTGRAPQSSARAGTSGTQRAEIRTGSLKISPSMAISPNTKRNLILAAVLIFLVLICVIIFGAQSCAGKKQEEGTSNIKDNVQLKVPEKSDNSTSAGPIFAEYTDQSTALDIKSEYGILIDLDKNEVIASKNAEAKIYPASMTKIMTLIVAYENISDLEDTFTFTADLLDPLYLENASVAGFSAGETVCLEDIIYGCILPSGADCTSALAKYVAGSEREFAEMMNEKAAALGLKNTHFVTASGLHDNDHYSTCHEMAIILEYAISNDYMRKVLSTYKYYTKPTDKHPDGITLTSTLFSRMDGGEAEGVYVQGGKTGYTIEAKNCLATFAANCTEEQSLLVRPQYLLVTAYASGEYTPVFDAIDTYGKYCSGK